MSTTCNSKSACTTSSKRCLERLHQSVRQFFDEADRVRQQNILVRRQFQPPRRRVERGEQNVFRQNVRAGERVEQGGFAGVRVTDNRSQRPLAALASGALRRALAANFVEFAFNFVDALGTFRRSASSCDSPSPPRIPMPPRLPRQVAPESRESRQQMLQLREFDLQFAFARAGALREDVENQRRAIQDFAVEDFFQVAALRGRKFIVENHRVHVVRLAEF